MSVPRVLALDIALSTWGVCDHDGPRTIKFPGNTKNMTRYEAIDRLDWWLAALVTLAMPGATPDLIVIEGYSYASGQGAHQIGELGGVIRHEIQDAGIRWVEVSPSSLKMYATGTGNAKKDAVLAEAIRRLGYQGSSHDAADAMWLHAMALDHYGCPPVVVPAKNRGALVKVAWPVPSGPLPHNPLPR